ncbi:MAG: OB-fold domain-containing protein [Chloroflexi bacterium]|nr:OB-fold domain-containing protein [Chloroflexota bacterium]
MTTTDSTEKRVAAFEDLFTWPSDDPRLIATKCKSCGHCAFPKTFTCGNPNCKNKDVEDILLSKRGKLWSWSTQYYKPPPPFVAPDPYVPFAVGLVEFPEGIKVLGIVTGCNTPDEYLKINMEVEVVAEKLFVDEDGNEVIGWKFKPVG